jgi:hypothetical protein
VVLLDRLVAQLLVGNTVRISIRVAAPSGANVKTDSKAFGSLRDSPCSSAIRSGEALPLPGLRTRAADPDTEAARGVTS